MSEVQTFKVDGPYLDTRCKLGEGPHHNERLGEFRFLDIDGRKMYVFGKTLNSKKVEFGKTLTASKPLRQCE